MLPLTRCPFILLPFLDAQKDVFLLLFSFLMFEYEGKKNRSQTFEALS